MKVYIVDRDSKKVIDIVSDVAFNAAEYGVIERVYNLPPNWDWIRETYTDYKIMLERYKKVL